MKILIYFNFFISLSHSSVWYDPLKSPLSWRLDVTESRGRERRKLERCYLSIKDSKFLLPQYQHKIKGPSYVSFVNFIIFNRNKFFFN